MKEKFEYQKLNYNKKGNPNYRGGKDVPCMFCGKLVYRRPSDIAKNKNIFCSKGCFDNFRRKPKQEHKKRDISGKNHPNWSGTKYCKFCGIELFSGDERSREVCNSEQCKLKLKQSYVENRSTWKGEDIVSECMYCKKPIKYRPGRPKKYCSYECMHFGRRNRVTLNCEQCGKEFIVAAQRTRDENPRFCSLVCRRSYFGKSSLEIRVGSALDELGIKFIDQYRPKGTRKIFDFYLPQLGIIIEADGDFWHYSEWAEKNGTTKRDKEKDTWAMERNIKLIRLRESDVDKFGAKVLIENNLGLG